MFRYLSGFLASLLLALLLTAPVSAQTVPGVPSTGGSADASAPEIDPATMTEAEINAMVARMSDDQVRGLLLERLDAVAAQAAVAEPQASLIDRATRVWEAFYLPLIDVIRKVPALVTGQARAISNFIDHYGGLGGVLTLFGLTALVLAAGLAVEFVFRKWILNIRNPEVANADRSLQEALRFLIKRLFKEVIGLVVFYITIRVLGRLLLTPDQIAFAGPFVAYLIWMPRLAAAASRFMLAPHRSDFRLVNVNDHWAQFIHRHLVGIVLLGGATLFIVLFNQRNGVAMSETRIGFWLDSSVYLYVAWIAWTAREGLRDMMRGADPDRTEFDESVARIYPYFAIGLAAAMWVIVQLVAGLGYTALLLNVPHYVTMFWLLATPVIDTAVRGLVRHTVPPMQGEGPVAEAAYRSTKRSMVRIGRVIAIAIVVLLITRAWQISLISLLKGGVGIADNLFGFVMTVIFGYVIYEGVSLWINRRLAAEMTSGGMSEEEADAEMGGTSGSRLSTVLPLALVTAQSAILVIFGLLAVGSLGVDITPLLAGAGILGLAIGFGAQKLVTDVVSGVFFLIDDAFRVGEYVEIDGTMGAVEKISIRSMQLRHHRGPVHTIPYGEIPKLTNYSRDWVIMKLKFTVPFDTDPNKIKKIFKKIGQEMMADELYKDDFLQPFKSQGVFDIDDVGMIIRGKFMAKPGKQFMIRKEIYNRVKASFTEAGIDFARREVRVAIPGLDSHDDLTEEEKTQIMAAGAAAADQQKEQGAGAPPKGPD